ncbi:hypothetical protein JRQ81_019878 [Phrynocephalus forsythii]|uniref:Uncharacterized protein n=1 Tax=Phrynocephalus forsythii TaxID=171643 RepID=A0A9Q0XNU3_9SAUR|nr:hypothetical protein JRQ81_019878 [Phrynocephalus forsythii]
MGQGPPSPPPGSPLRGTRQAAAAAAAMDPRLKHSRLRFASVLSRIVEKYNFPFDDDLVVSIESLTYSTYDGPKVWGEESDLDCSDTLHQTFEEEQFTDSFGDAQPATEHKTNTELASIKRRLENIHIKENNPLVCYSGTPVKNKYRVQMDMLLGDGSSSAPEVVTIVGTRARNVHQWSPLQELDNNSSGCYPDVFEKQMPSTDEHSTLPALPPANSSVSSSADGIDKPQNISLWVARKMVSVAFWKCMSLQMSIVLGVM